MRVEGGFETLNHPRGGLQNDAPKPPLRPNGQPRAEGTRLGNERGEGVSRDRVPFVAQSREGHRYSGYEETTQVASLVEVARPNRAESR